MKKLLGFTLIELMIVVGIISILAVVGIPAYQDQVRKGRRSDAQQLMLDISSKEQQYLLDARQYTDTIGNLGISKDGWTCSGTSCTNAFYTITVAPTNSATPPTFLITAAVVAGSAQEDDGNLTLSNTDVRTHNGSTGW